MRSVKLGTWNWPISTGLKADLLRPQAVLSAGWFNIVNFVNPSRIIDLTH